MAGKSKATSVDAYIASAPGEAQAMLQQLRKVIRAAAPRATEGISYGVPGYKHAGRPLIYFGAAKAHCSLYGVVGEAFKEELKSYDTSKGTIRFPLGRPLPSALVKRIVKARIAENEAKAQMRAKG
jgi:uncharacterized protein YdhG (YjbR/CyaY superfamily)